MKTVSNTERLLSQRNKVDEECRTCKNKLIYFHCNSVLKHRCNQLSKTSCNVVKSTGKNKRISDSLQ